jgi:hypothetical protein
MYLHDLNCWDIGDMYVFTNNARVDNTYALRADLGACVFLREILQQYQ